MKFLQLVLLLLLLSVSIKSISVDTTNSQASQVIASFHKSIPRLTFTGKVAPTTFDPTSGDYWQGLGTLSVFGFVCSILAILFALLFLRLRRCGLFGGYEPTKGCWKPCGELKTDSYPKWLIVLTIMLSLLFALILIGVGTLAIIENQVFYQNFESGRGTLRDTISQTVNVTSEIHDTFIYLTQLMNVSDATLQQVITQLTALRDSQIALQNSTSTLIIDIGRVDKVRYLILIIICVICFMVPFLTSFSGVACCKGVSLFGFKIGTYALVGVWIGFAIHFPAAVLTSDFCTTVDTYVNTYNTTNSTNTNSTFNQAQAILNVILKCQTQGSILQVQPLLIQGSQLLVAELNYDLTSNDPLNRTYYYTMNNCSLSLNEPFVQNNPNVYKIISAQVNIMLQYQQAMDKFNSLLNCVFVANAFTSIRNSACLGGLYSMEILWVIFLCLGIIMIPTSLLALSGYKLFRKQTTVKPQPKKDGIEVEMVNLNGRMVPLEQAEVV